MTAKKQPRTKWIDPTAPKEAASAVGFDLNTAESTVAQDPNPMPADVVEASPSKLRVPQPNRPSHQPPSPPESFDSESLLLDLSSLPVESLTYAQCGPLINALSAATAAVANRRRQAQEQLEAGTRKVPCRTCGRTVDITKPGGFQILTERDELHQVVNRYFCSQNCLLGRNMPSHRTKKLPGDIGVPSA